MINNNQRTVFSVDTVASQTTYYQELDTIMGNPMCSNLDNLIFTIVKSGTNIIFEINFKYKLSRAYSPNVTEISIYHNPATDMVYLDIDYGHNLDISIYDYTGRLIYREMTNNKMLNIAQLQNGLYILVVNDNLNVYTTKLLVE